MCRQHIFTIFTPSLVREAESIHSECKQHMDIVHISAEGSEFITPYDGAPSYRLKIYTKERKKERKKKGSLLLVSDDNFGADFSCDRTSLPKSKRLV